MQSVFLAGGGIPGGTVIGASDRIGGYPKDNPQRAEDLAATIYHALGIPPTPPGPIQPAGRITFMKVGR